MSLSVHHVTMPFYVWSSQHITWSMGWCKRDVIPMCQQWNYAFFALTHRDSNIIIAHWIPFLASFFIKPSISRCALAENKNSIPIFWVGSSQLSPTRYQSNVWSYRDGVDQSDCQFTAVVHPKSTFFDSFVFISDSSFHNWTPGSVEFNGVMMHLYSSNQMMVWIVKIYMQ